MANFFGFNSYLKLFCLSLLSLWYPRSTKVLCCVKSCTRHVCTLNLTHLELSSFFFFFFLLQPKRNSAETGTQTTWGPWSSRLQLWVTAGARLSLTIQLNQEELYTFFSTARPLPWNHCCAQFFFSCEGWVLNHHSQIVCVLTCLDRLWPWLWSELWQLWQPAALCPSTLIITVFLISSTTRVTVNRGLCKDVLIYSEQESLKQHGSTRTKIWTL